MKTHLEVYEAELSHVSIDKEFVNTVVGYDMSFVNSKEENIIFLNACLLGTPKFRFTDSDRDNFFTDVAQIEERVLHDSLMELGKNFYDPATKRIGSDILGLTVIYLVYKLRKSKLTTRLREQAERSLWRILHYKWLGSLMHGNFGYEPKREKMEATIASLNNRFDLKKAGSWMKWIDLRIDELMGPTIHRRRIDKFQSAKFSDNDGVAYVLTDSQGRIRGIVRHIWVRYSQILEDDSAITSRKAFIDLEDGPKLRDVIKSGTKYREYIKSTMSSRENFIRQDLLLMTEDVINNSSEANRERIVDVLRYFVDNYGPRGDKKVELIVDTLIGHAMDSISSAGKSLKPGTNIVDIIYFLKALWTSPKSSNPDVLLLRKETEKIVVRVTKLKNTVSINQIRTGILTYVMLRTLVMNYYS